MNANVELDTKFLTIDSVLVRLLPSLPYIFLKDCFFKKILTSVQGELITVIMIASTLMVPTFAPVTMACCYNLTDTRVSAEGDSQSPVAVSTHRTGLSVTHWKTSSVNGL